MKSKKPPNRAELYFLPPLELFAACNVDINARSGPEGRYGAAVPPRNRCEVGHEAPTPYGVKQFLWRETIFVNRPRP
jgi:hypothetical protein